MNDSNQLYKHYLFLITHQINKINYMILTKKFDSIADVRDQYLLLSKEINNKIPDLIEILVDNKKINLKKELLSDIEKSYLISIRILKSFLWGEFAEISKNKFPELFQAMIDKNGDLLRSYDNFDLTVAVLDFHGYTQFSNDIKYNKTPLQEFGNILPQKIKKICEIFKSIVYEMEGDAIIIIGPKNPIFVINAVLSIIEISRQKPFLNRDPKKIHGYDLKNPMIKPFEMNASLTTGGETFINSNGRIVGALISEANRILKIINTKKPHKSGLLISEKVYRKLEKFKNTKLQLGLDPFSFDITDSFILDVKGMRLTIRELLIVPNKYFTESKTHISKLNTEIKSKSPTKWHKILISYINLILSAIRYSKFSISIGDEDVKQDSIKIILINKLENWITFPTPEIIIDILRMCDRIYNKSEEIKDLTAIYHEYIQENYMIIAKNLENFFDKSLKEEKQNKPAVKKIVDNYYKEMDNIRKRYNPKRILETILSKSNLDAELLQYPYMGKK